VIGWLLAATGAVAFWRWRRHRAIARWAAAWSAAFAASDWPLVEEMVRQALGWTRTPAERAQLQLVLANALGRMGRVEEAAAALDPSLAAHLPPRDMATWLNNHGYHLAQVGRCEEALDSLEQAEVILEGDDDLASRLVYTCVSGNRGLAALRCGELDRAEALIEQGRRDTGAIVATLPAGDPWIEQARVWDEERRSWLADIARQRRKQQ
jgi:tetratricopeptide (TPR) repeat protein